MFQPVVCYWQLLALTLLALAIWTVFHVSASESARAQPDDAYVTYRYAANLAAGKGFVYNDGDRVLGTTTPLYAVLLSGLASIFGSGRIPNISVAVNLFAAAGTGIFTCLALLHAGLGRRLALLATAACLFHPQMIWWVNSGLEVTVVLLLMSASLYAAVRKRDALAFGLCGLALLLRIDTIVWTFSLAVPLILSRSRKTLAYAFLTFIAVILPWALFATLYFGSPIPLPVLAKSIIRPPIVNPTDGISLVEPESLRAMAKWLHSAVVPPLDAPMASKIMVALVVDALVATGLWRLAKTPGVIAAMPAFAILYAIAFYIGKAPRFDWYLVPLVWVCGVAFGCGVVRLVDKISEARVCRQPRAGPRLYAAVAASLAVVMAYGSAREVNRLSSRTEHLAGLATGQFLRAQSPGGSTLVTEAIGYIGFYSEFLVVDLAGLVTPEAVATARSGAVPSAVLQWAITAHRPEWVVLGQGEVDSNAYVNGGPLFVDERQRAEFYAEYVEVARFPTSRSPEGYAVFRRRAV